MYILDANILIDLDNGALIETLLALPYIFATPDLVLEEFNTDRIDDLNIAGLEEVAFDGDQIGEILAIASQHGGLSIPDSAACLIRLKQNSGLR